MTLPPWCLRVVSWLQIVVGWLPSALPVAVRFGVMKRE